MSQRKLLFKIVVVGDGGIGKSTMIQRLTTGLFIPQKITIGTDLATHDVQIGSVNVRLQIWDFAGERRFRIFLPNYSRGASGVLLCYDITRHTSLVGLREWFNITDNNTLNPVYILVGGKLDLADIRRSVEIKQAEKFMKEYTDDTDPDGSIPKWEFMKVLNEWLGENRFRSMSDKTIAKRMREKNIEDGRVYVDFWEEEKFVKKQIRAWVGVKFKGEKKMEVRARVEPSEGKVGDSVRLRVQFARIKGQIKSVYATANHERWQLHKEKGGKYSLNMRIPPFLSA
ncbi:hypothetical protein LCGC14_2345190, partial [marine sediment metagenome]